MHKVIRNTLQLNFAFIFQVEVEALRKENNNAYTAGLFRTQKMSLCDFLEQKPQYAGTFSNFGNIPKKCPIRAVSVCRPTWFCSLIPVSSIRT
jgi:hypothetical protein